MEIQKVLAQAKNGQVINAQIKHEKNSCEIYKLKELESLHKKEMICNNFILFFWTFFLKSNHQEFINRNEKKIKIAQ